MHRASATAVPTASSVYRLAAGLSFAMMRLQGWQIRVAGLEHIPRQGGAVLVSNHTSYWDFLTTGAGPYLAWGRPVRILAKASLFDAPLVGPVMRRAGHIPVRRAAGARALRDAVRALRSGELVLVLPEQTISPSFELLAFKQGAVRMAAAARVPLVPAVSWGSHRFHTVGRRPRPVWGLPVSVRYGQALRPGPNDDPARLNAVLRRRMRRLLDSVQRSYPDGTPSGAWWVPARLGGGAPTSEQAAEYVSRLEETWKAAAERLRHAREQVRHEAVQARERLDDAREAVRDEVHEQAQHARERLQEGIEHTRDRLGRDPTSDRPADHR